MCSASIEHNENSSSSSGLYLPGCMTGADDVMDTGYNCNMLIAGKAQISATPVRNSASE